MGFFDKVKNVLTTSDAQRARKGHEEADRTTGAAPAGGEAEVQDSTTTAAAPTVEPTTAAVAPEEEISAEATGQRTHTVVKGDTLAAIAERHGVDRSTLAELNQIDNPDLIYPGQVLRLPEA